MPWIRARKVQPLTLFGNRSWLEAILGHSVFDLGEHVLEVVQNPSEENQLLDDPRK